MLNVKILYDSYTSVTQECDPDDVWDRDDTATDHTITGFKLVDDKDYFDLPIDFEPELQTYYYLLYVNYDTGDSFGRDEGQIEFMGLYDNKGLAEENLSRIEEFSSGATDRGSFTLNLLNRDGKEYIMYAPWVGYFEHLNGAYIQKVLCHWDT